MQRRGNMEYSTKPDKGNFMLAGVSIPHSLHMANRPERKCYHAPQKSSCGRSAAPGGLLPLLCGSRQTEQSIEGQRRDCEAYARAHGMTILREYVDRHISGKLMTAPPSSSWWPTAPRTPLTP